MKKKIIHKKTSNSSRSSIKYLVKSELGYLKKEHILLVGPKSLVLKSITYLYERNRKPKITILAFTKNELISLLNSTVKFKGLRYTIAKSEYTGLPEQEFGLIIAYEIFDKLGGNKSIALLKEFYRMAKPNCIVIVTGSSINELLKKYNSANFQKAEIINYKGESYLKLVKLSNTSLLPQ